MANKNFWSEDPKTQMECVTCKTTWKLEESIGCPKCNGKDGGLNSTIFLKKSLKERAGYIAGIIDGEAYIGIKKSTYGMRKRKDVHSPTYSERIQIRMKNPQILSLMKNLFGGRLYHEPKIYQSKSGFKSNNRMWLYCATDKRAIAIAKAVYPYCIEKKQQIKCLFKLRESKESKEARMRGGRNQKRTMKPEILAYREKLYLNIKKLNHGLLVGEV